MILFKYTIRLLDPLFYSREGLGAAVTPRYIHATAVNHAVAYATGAGENQPYIMSEENGGRNVPRYKSSHIALDFYFTPARMKGNPRYMPEIVKGELDGFVCKGYPGAEVLRASQIFSLAPDTEFEGFGYCNDMSSVPEIIRLGSFRGKARLAIHSGRFLGKAENQIVDHPTDPLVTDTTRGTMVTMFPYPIIENPVCRTCCKIKLKGERFPFTIAVPVTFSFDETPIKGDTAVF